MANTFDQFDQPEPEANPFDQFGQSQQKPEAEPIPISSPGVQAFVGGALEGIPIVGGLLLELGEAIRSLLKDRPIEEIQAETQKLFEDNPNLKAAGNITGAILGTAPLGIGSVGTALFSTVPRAVGTGAVLAGADVAARGGGPQDILFGAGLGAAGGAAGVGLVKLGRGVVSLVRGPRGELSNVIASASDDLVSQARALYKQADAVGVKLKSKTFNKMVDKIVTAARPTGDLAEEILAKNTPKAAGVMKWLQGLKGREPTLSEIDQVRQFIGDVAKSIDPGERRLGKLMVDALDDALDNLKNANFVKTELKESVSALQQARGLWRRGKILETISGAAEKAELANQPTGQAVQQRLRTLLGNKKFKRSLTKEERDILTQVVKSPADRVLAILGQLRTQIGAVSVGAAAGGLTESVTTGGAVALGMAATGSGARGLRNVLAQQRLKDATRAIAGQKRLPKATGAEPLAGAVGTAGGVTIERELIDVQE